MLMLTRRVQETLHIGDDIQVTVLEIKGNQIRIGITAPESVHIVREELLTPPLGKQATSLDTVQPLAT